MAQAKSPELKAKIIAAWHEAEANNESRKSFHERVKGTELEVTYGGLQNWLNPKSSKSFDNTTKHTPAHTAPILTAATLDDVEAAYKRSIETLIASLEEQEQQLQAELESVMNDLIRARDKLTKFD
ncbi:hypothetical protein [Pseudomonas syringae group genomosp. 3]|uniref:KfrA N-terminal DNA-binding domain-containing protein n=1 Tax=Pseudomonas syringae pv. persicae TaxID=237306 RepID=A0AB38EFQ9_9PSED|nr:hypothetical protein [Pseudomonas syringae group genomosp. 3]SOQ09176.1 hypothetical protein NCPPB2254_02217 [Pseudomonas syringae pv. persicae]SOQ09233.1 hypothetical protein CFBP1573P_02391 [Pseudomonas syringae pv. persicae]